MTNKVPTSESKFVGVWLSRQTNSFLSLYALSKRTSKSAIIRGIIKVWIEGKPSEKYIQELISEITGRLQWEWKDKKRVYHSTDINRRFALYKEDLYVMLDRKGLAEEHTTRILEGLVE